MSFGYIAKLHEDLIREHVRFNNRYGIAIAGDLYRRRDLDESRKHPALIVGAPYGGVKEQGPCVYANEMAERGFVVLTFDQVFMGESGGEPRRVSSPELFAESFSAGVDFLGVKVPYVDREQIGVIGICGSGGFALSAAQADTRIKAVATASMYDISDVRGKFAGTREEFEAMKKRLSEQRWTDFENGSPEYIPSFPEEPYAENEVPHTGTEADIWNAFYAVPRGHHPNARGGFTTTSNLAMINFRSLDFIDEISPRPILFIVGDRAHSIAYSEKAYAAAAEPKELYVVEDADHIDLYDRTDRIPFAKLEEFFRTNLSR